MALLQRNRSKSQATVPQELADYYQSEQRDRRGLAWLLALGTLIVTVVVFSGVFFGGRAIYRALTGDDVAETPAKPATTASSSTNKPKTTTATPKQPAAPSPTPPSTASTTTPTTPPATATTNPSNLPNTGPDQDL